MQPGGTSQQLLGVDAVREFNVLRDSYSAEYGKRPGAQVLIVTQSGSNLFHGSAVRISAKQRPRRAQLFRPGAPRRAFSATNLELRSAGRSRKNKTFLFGNFEGFHQHLHQTGVDLVPDTQCTSRLSALQNRQPRAEPVPHIRGGSSWAFRR